MKTVNGGVCAAKGFYANGIHCGIRKNKSKKDLSLIFSEKVANASAVYTTNLVKGAPLVVTKKNISDGKAQAVICNSGNANTCNANGIEIAEKMCGLLADNMKIKASDVVVASTGVIGQPLCIDPIADGISSLVKGLSKNGGEAAAEFFCGRQGCHRRQPVQCVGVGSARPYASSACELYPQGSQAERQAGLLYEYGVLDGPFPQEHPV